MAQLKKRSENGLCVTSKFAAINKSLDRILIAANLLYELSSEAVHVSPTFSKLNSMVLGETSIAEMRSIHIA